MKKYNNDLKLIKANILPWKRNMEHKIIYSKPSLSTAKSKLVMKRGRGTGMLYNDPRGEDLFLLIS